MDVEPSGRSPLYMRHVRIWCQGIDFPDRTYIAAGAGEETLPPASRPGSELSGTGH